MQIHLFVAFLKSETQIMLQFYVCDTIKTSLTAGWIAFSPGGGVYQIFYFFIPYFFFVSGFFFNFIFSLSFLRNKGDHFLMV